MAASSIRLLVSVRNAKEAVIALNGGARVIDVKEPDLGSLGRAADRTIEDVLEAIRGRVPVTAALGELAEIREVGSPPRELMAVKMGLSRCAADPSWRTTWRKRFEAAKAKERVAVVYADSHACGAPAPTLVLEAAVELQCQFLLVDTFEKQRSMLDMAIEDVDCGAQLDRTIRDARSAGMQIVLAGSLRRADFAAIIARWAPDIVAVRGAACVGERTGAVSEALVAELASTLEDLTCDSARR